MTQYIGTEDDDRFADDMLLESKLDLIVELADQAAQGAIITYMEEDWHRSPRGRMLAAAVRVIGRSDRIVPPAVAEAVSRFEAAASPSC